MSCHLRNGIPVDTTHLVLACAFSRQHFRTDGNPGRGDTGKGSQSCDSVTQQVAARLTRLVVAVAPSPPCRRVVAVGPRNLREPTRTSEGWSEQGAPTPWGLTSRASALSRAAMHAVVSASGGAGRRLREGRAWLWVGPGPAGGLLLPPRLRQPWGRHRGGLHVGSSRQDGRGDTSAGRDLRVA